MICGPCATVTRPIVQVATPAPVVVPMQLCEPPSLPSVMVTDLPAIGAAPSGSMSSADSVAGAPCWISCWLALEVIDASSSKTVNVADAEALAYCESPPKLAATVYGPAASLGVTGHDTLPLESVVLEQLSVPLSEKS